MKIRQIAFAFFIAATIFQIIHAQSGRAIESPTPMPEAVIPTEAIKEYPPCEKGLAEVIYLPPKIVKDFIEDVNRFGRCGYRLEKSNKLPLNSEGQATEARLFGIVKLSAGDKFEYEWFEAESPGEIVTRTNLRARKGFYFRQNIVYIGGKYTAAAERERKESTDALGTLGQLLNINIGTGGSLFIFERKNGIVKKCEYRVLDGLQTNGKKALARNQEKLNQYAADGFRPVGIHYTGAGASFVIIVEKDEAVKPEGEYLLLRQHLSLDDKFNKLGRQGYQPLFIGFYFMVLHRTKNAPLPFVFDSAEHDAIIKKVPKWTQRNSKYYGKGLTGFDTPGDVYEGEIYFATRLVGDAKKYEYQFLEMTNFYERYFKKKDKTATHRDPPNAEMLRKFSQFLQEGYAVRDIYFFPEITVVFERVSEMPPIKF